MCAGSPPLGVSMPSLSPLPPSLPHPPPPSSSPLPPSPVPLSTPPPSSPPSLSPPSFPTTPPPLSPPSSPPPIRPRTPKAGQANSKGITIELPEVISLILECGDEINLIASGREEEEKGDKETKETAASDGGDYIETMRALQFGKGVCVCVGVCCV